MAPQIKHDLNRSGWESTDLPSVCERCLPENPYVQMIKDDYGAECKVCTRPFTNFKWKADRTCRQKRTIICLTCSRLKNCCQCCMLDLSFGLPLPIRDKALKMIRPGPESSVNREYYAQEHEKEIEEGRGAVEAYEKTDEKAMELLKKLSQSEAYNRRRRVDEDEEGKNMRALAAPDSMQQGSTPGPVRTRDTRPRGGARKNPIRPSLTQKPPSQDDWLPPNDPKIKSLFVQGVEEDLPEYKVREFFANYGVLQSVVCSHRSHCAYINYTTRNDAEYAADSLKGKAVIAGCPLRITWGKPRQLDTLDRDTRISHAREGRAAAGSLRVRNNAGAITAGDDAQIGSMEDDGGGMKAVAPPGQDDVQYASLAGD